MRPPHVPDPVTVLAYLAGDRRPDVVRPIRRWLSADPHAARELSALETAHRNLGLDLEPLTDDHRREAWRALSQRLDLSASRLAPRFTVPPRDRAHDRARDSMWRRLRPLAIGVAACVAVIAAVFWSGAAGRDPLSQRTYATAPGQNATVTLRDGSRIVMGPSTTVRVSRGGSAPGTTVSVDGQALFRVAHASGAPFTVRTSNSETRVLGTTFLVRRYGNDRATRVVVLDGRVSVVANRASARPAVLTASTLGLVSDSGDVRTVADAVVENDTAWASGRLEFRDADMRDIVAEIGRVYGTEIRIADSALVARKITCTVQTADHSLDAVLNALAASVDAHVTRAGRVRLLVPGVVASPERRLPAHHPLTLESEYGR